MAAQARSPNLKQPPTAVGTWLNMSLWRPTDERESGVTVTSDQREHNRLISGIGERRRVKMNCSPARPVLASAKIWHATKSNPARLPSMFASPPPDLTLSREAEVTSSVQASARAPAATSRAFMGITDESRSSMVACPKPDARERQLMADKSRRSLPRRHRRDSRQRPLCSG